MCLGLILTWLVVSTPLKHMKLSWDDYEWKVNPNSMVPVTTNQLMMMNDGD